MHSRPHWSTRRREPAAASCRRRFGGHGAFVATCPRQRRLGWDCGFVLAVHHGHERHVSQGAQSERAAAPVRPLRATAAPPLHTPAHAHTGRTNTRTIATVGAASDFSLPSSAVLTARPAGVPLSFLHTADEGHRAVLRPKPCVVLVLQGQVLPRQWRSGAPPSPPALAPGDGSPPAFRDSGLSSAQRLLCKRAGPCTPAEHGASASVKRSRRCGIPCRGGYHAVWDTPVCFGSTPCGNPPYRAVGDTVLWGHHAVGDTPVCFGSRAVYADPEKVNKLLMK